MEKALLYHETQEAKLCAVHCLNAVLQGPYFSELELAAIARELDQTERNMMLENGEQSADYLRFVSEGSSNVALDGNFSIQVLEKALGMLDLKCVPLNSPDLQAARAEPHKQSAYICNLEDHWFTLRRVGTEWYNFNSLLAAPQHLSNFYMSAFLDTLKNEGWSIFVVQGELPRDYNSTGSVDSGSAFGRWFTPKQAEETLARANVEETNTQDDDYSADPMLAAAIKASLNDLNQPGATSNQQLNEDELNLAAALAASLADVRPPGPM